MTVHDLPCITEAGYTADFRRLHPDEQFAIVDDAGNIRCVVGIGPVRYLPDVPDLPELAEIEDLKKGIVL